MSATAIATFTTRDEDEEITNGPAKWSALRSRYSQERIDKARKLYQPWYQIGKGYASENEEWLSRLDKDEANGTVPSWWTPPTNIRVPESANGYPVPPFARTPAQQPPINITTKLELDGRVIAEAVNEVTTSPPPVAHREDRTDGMGNRPAGRQLPGRRLRYHQHPRQRAA
jgi:hypothetical protein